jgi:2-methylcitrate dehydratase PrpD
MASGLRENFGTMTKSLLVGRAASNGVTAAQLAAAGYTAASNILEADRGFSRAMGGGFSLERIAGKLGQPYFYLAPGVSIKPHPSGSLTHPGMALMQRMLVREPFSANEVESIDVGTASNIPNALIHAQPQNALEGKFSMQFCMAILVLERKGGIREFQDEVVRRPDVQDLVRKVRLYVHPELEALGYERMRTIIDVTLKDGRRLHEQGDVARGHPENPMPDDELVAKFHECAAEALSRDQADRIVETVWRLEDLEDTRSLARLLAGTS